jgi:hypothetical protein
MTLQIIGQYDDVTPLYCKYSGQSKPQSAYVEIDGENQKIWADYNAEIGNAIPVRVHNGINRRVDAPIYLTGESVVKYLFDVKSILEPALEGFRIEWDGNNHIGIYPNWTVKIDRTLEALYTEWATDEFSNLNVADDPGEYYYYVRNELGVTADKTDAELDEIIRIEENDALSARWVVKGLREYIYNLRETAQESAKEGEKKIE